ncbi:TetR/AcrR family transcriptional regulator [Ectobacillus sp. sgz5001026]|uniref:TetR/AcrR family transcriptional regulator n=1 Tax=Ectobacillus sp. sgz5001026 TaxID=3242473 RepID=UPI0036D2D1E3
MQPGEDTRIQIIVEQAIELFSTKGYDITLDELVDRSGISKTVILNYFKSKEDILQFISRQQIHSIQEHIRRLQNQMGLLTPTIIQLFVDFSNDIQNSQTLMQTLFQSSLRNPTFRQNQYEAVGLINDVLEDLFERGQKSGELTTLLSAYTMAQLASQQYFGILLNWCMSSENYCLQDRVKVSFGMLFNGLLNRY